MKKILDFICEFIKKNPKLFLVILVIIVFSLTIIGKDGCVPIVIFAIVTIFALAIGLHFTNKQNEPIWKKLFAKKESVFEKIKTSKTGLLFSRFQSIMSSTAIQAIMVFVFVSFLVIAILFTSSIRIKIALSLGVIAATVFMIIWNPNTWHRRVAVSLIILVNATQICFVVSGEMSCDYSLLGKILKDTMLPETKEEIPQDTLIDVNDHSCEVSSKGIIEAIPAPIVVQVSTIAAALVILVVGELRRKR